jgi:plastocyanin
VRRRVTLLAVSIVAAGSIATIPGALGADSAARGSDNARVRVLDFVYKPKRVTIGVGGRVTWAFKEGIHNVTGKGWKSRRTVRRGTYSHRFRQAGKYNYRCTIHQPRMDGVVRVVR